MHARTMGDFDRDPTLSDRYHNKVCADCGAPIGDKAIRCTVCASEFRELIKATAASAAMITKGWTRIHNAQEFLASVSRPPYYAFGIRSKPKAHENGMNKAEQNAPVGGCSHSPGKELS